MMVCRSWKHNVTDRKEQHDLLTGGRSGITQAENRRILKIAEHRREKDQAGRLIFREETTPD